MGLYTWAHIYTNIYVMGVLDQCKQSTKEKHAAKQILMKAQQSLNHPGSTCEMFFAMSKQGGYWILTDCRICSNSNRMKFLHACFFSIKTRWRPIRVSWKRPRWRRTWRTVADECNSETYVASKMSRSKPGNMIATHIKYYLYLFSYQTY